MPEHLAETDQDDEGGNHLTPDHGHEGAFKAPAVADQEDAHDDPHHHPCDQAGCQQPQPPLAYQHALGHDAYTHGQGVCPEQESARDRGQVEEPFDKRRQGEQDRADARRPAGTRRRGAPRQRPAPARPSGPWATARPRATCKALAGTSNSSAIPASAASAPKIAGLAERAMSTRYRKLPRLTVRVTAATVQRRRCWRSVACSALPVMLRPPATDRSRTP